MNRILLVTERFWPEDFVVNEFAYACKQQGRDIVVLTQQPSYPRGRMFRGYKNKLLSRQYWRGVEIIRIKTVLGYRDCLGFKILNYFWFAFAGSLAALMLQKRFDVVFIYHSGPLTMSIPGLVYAKTRSIPVTIWTQDIWPDSVYAYGFKKSKLLVRSLDAFVAWVYGSVTEILISCEGFRRALERYTQKNLIYAPNWPLLIYEHKAFLIKTTHQKIFMFAGNVGKVQNLENVILGFAAALRMGLKQSKLRIIGDGSALASLKMLAEQEGILVDFCGRKSAEEMQAEYGDADYLVLSLLDSPVFRLTVPSKFQMYLSVGKPILCIAQGEVARLVSENNIGVIADPSAVQSIGKAFCELASMTTSKVHSIEAKSREMLNNNYDKDKIISTVFAAIDSSIEKYPQKSHSFR